MIMTDENIDLRLLREQPGGGACPPERQERQPRVSDDRTPLVPDAKPLPLSMLSGLSMGQTPDFEKPQPKKKPAKPAGKGTSLRRSS
jgi:hypothetical protein